MADQLPYRAEYAKSGRASCKACRTTIEKDSLRLAAMVQSPMFDGKVPNWYHYNCFFTKQRPKVVGDIENFESLKWDDQEKIKEKLQSLDSLGVDKGVGKSSKSKKATKRASSSNSASAGKSQFSIEYAKSGRAACRGCEEKILQNEVRVAKMDFESDQGRRYGGIPMWHHLACFAKLRKDLEFWESGNSLPGFSSLKSSDQEEVCKLLPKITAEVKDEVDGVSVQKKIKTEPVDSKTEEEMKKQNKIMFKYVESLKSLKKPHLQLLLTHNGQSIPHGNSSMIDRIADIMTFGALEPCDKCGGQLSYVSGTGYKCKGDLSEWVKCDNVSVDPKRKVFKVPKELAEEYEFLKRYKGKVVKRLMQLNQPSVHISDSASASGPKVKSEHNFPLKNMEFVILGKTETPKDELKNTIIKMGGKVTTKIHKMLAAVISTQEEIEKMNKRMQEVKDCDVQVVPENFLEESIAGGAAENIRKLCISPWGSDPKKRLEVVESMKSTKSKSMFTKSVPSKVTIKVKGGTAVDPDSGLEDVAHVYKKGSDIYSTVLGLTDLQSGTNKYYKLQILESDKGHRYWVFRSWGRIGTTIGSQKLEAVESMAEAKKIFTTHFAEKSGNLWEDRHNFKKVAGKMYPMDLSYGDEDNEVTSLAAASDVESKLPKPVQDLVTLIFDVDSMKKVMLEYELDLQKMPLGKISKRQIQQAYYVLTELQTALRESEPTRAKILDVSNRFYTLIPHDFGIDNPPPLDSEDIIKKKIEMLDSLMEMEVAYSLLKTTKEEDSSGIHPVDLHYNKLNAEIEVLDRTSKEFELLQIYVKNTHAATHSQYELEILDVFKVSRIGEDKRYKPFKKLHNRKLLWHGSRLTNFAGIISQGLRIAPPEAPTTGYMFGKGIYFADMVSKSANYCMTTPSNSIGLMLLCEVALGNMHEKAQAEYIEKLPPGKHSCKGVGATHPDPEHSVVMEDGVEVPLGPGKPVLERHQTSLLYNEYIVYDVGQVKVRYLLKMNFKYRF